MPPLPPPLSLTAPLLLTTDRSVAAVTIVVVVVVVVDVDVLLLPFSVSMIGDCECRSFVGDALLFPSLIGELTFTE